MALAPATMACICDVVESSEDGVSIDGTLILEGLVTAWTGGGQHRDDLPGVR